MHRRRFLQLSLAAGLAASLPGCGRGDPLRVGIHPWIGYEPLYLAEEFGWLPDTVQLVKGTAARDSMSGLLSGQLDAAALTLDEALRVCSAGVDLRLVAVTNVSVGADMLLVRPDITAIEQLKGRAVGVELNGVSGVMLLHLLERAGLTTGDISVVDIPVDQHLEAWNNGLIDASVCYQPVAARLEQAGAVSLFDSRELPDTIFDVLAVTHRAEGRQPGPIKDLVAGHFAGYRYLVRNLHDAVYRIATRQGMAPELIRQALATVMLPDLAANQRYLAKNGTIETTAIRLAGLLEREGLMDKHPEHERIASQQFLPRRAE